MNLLLGRSNDTLKLGLKINAVIKCISKQWFCIQEKKSFEYKAVKTLVKMRTSNQLV